MRTVRLLLAAAALAGTAAVATPASADPPIILCRFWLDQDHPIAETYGLPVYVAVPSVQHAC